MLDLHARRSRAKGDTRRHYATIVCAQVCTAVATGFVIGYLAMFPLVMGIASYQANQRDPESKNEPWQNLSDALSETRGPDRFFVDPLRVFLCTSLACATAVYAGIIFVTRVEQRHIEKDGGWAVGMAVDARRITTPADVDERKLFNVVEELAIVFQTKQPAVLVLDGEPGINVFAAGLCEDDHILCVTAGAMKHLRRDELQAVIAHEYSHLVHGDTALGTRLTAILLGLNSIRTAAESLFAGGQQLAGGNTRAAGNGYMMMAIAALVWPFGVAGTLAAAGLTLAITRSQELLADAEAVEKTRNPKALADALRRIMGHPQQGHLRSPQVHMIAPMLFVGCRRTRGIFSTHPPIKSRILAIDPLGPTTAIWPAATAAPSIRSASPSTAAAMGLMFAETQLLASSTTHQRAPDPNRTDSTNQWVQQCQAWLAARDNHSADPNVDGAEAELDPQSFAEAALIVLSVVCGIDGDGAVADYEFLRGWQEFGFADAERIPIANFGWQDFEWALEKIANAADPDRHHLLLALANVISGDGRTSPEEEIVVDVIRAVAHRFFQN